MNLNLISFSPILAITNPYFYHEKMNRSCSLIVSNNENTSITNKYNGTFIEISPHFFDWGNANF